MAVAPLLPSCIDIRDRYRSMGNVLPETVIEPDEVQGSQDVSPPRNAVAGQCDQSAARAEELIERYGDFFGPAWVEAVRSRIGEEPLNEAAFSRDVIYE